MSCSIPMPRGARDALTSPKPQADTDAAFDFDVEAEFADLPYPRVSELRRLRALGVSPSALCEPDFLRRAHVVFVYDRPLFDFARERGAEGVAVLAFIFLARDELGAPMDLVAWAPASGQLAAWKGAAALLGTNSLWAPRIGADGTLDVYENPLTWLKAGRRGVVPVDLADAAPQLRDARPLWAETLELGNRLDAAINAPVQIVVPRYALGAAA